MKLDSAFNNFLDKTVNLNKARYDRALSAADTMRSLLINNEVFGDNFIDLKPQGSFRQETIIKPVDEDTDFDVDLFFEMRQVEGWEPVDYLTKLADEFRKLDRYKDLVDTRGKTRCVTIDYETDFHIDLVPSITLETGQSVVMNKVDNSYEITDGDGYSKWFEDQNRIVGNKFLIKVIRLMKYIRDSRGGFEAKSIVLTTLLGNMVSATDIQSRDYLDISTTFVTLINRLDEYLQSNLSMPMVMNPVLPSEDFNRHWDQDKYQVFRKRIHEYTQIANEAYAESDEAKSLKKWQKIFGDEFTGPSILRRVGEAILSLVGGFKVGDHSHRQSLKDVGIIDPGSYPLSVKITAELYWGRPDHKEINRTHKGSFSSGALLPPNHWLKYQVNGNFEPHHEIYWQVVNTGPQAREWKKLRGKIEQGSYIQWEPSLFTGVHWIECYVIDSKTNTCIGRSGPFYVVFKNSSYPYNEENWN